MLVTFRSSSYADITMFGDVATKLLKMMDQSGEVPGAILADAVTTARDALLQKLSTIEPEKVDADAHDADEASISLSTRAQPLLELLEASIAGGSDVIWDS